MKANKTAARPAPRRLTLPPLSNRTGEPEAKLLGPYLLRMAEVVRNVVVDLEQLDADTSRSDPIAGDWHRAAESLRSGYTVLWGRAGEAMLREEQFPGDALTWFRDAR